MNIKTVERVGELKKELENMVKEMIDYINDQYTEDNTPVFLKEGEIGGVNLELQTARNTHLAFLKNVENRICLLFLKVEETMSKVQFPNEAEWIKNVEKEAVELMSDLKGLK